MDSLSRFAVFVQVAETRSFVAAGRILGVSASAVGKSISRLEDKLGVRLFHRSTRSITLTAEGARFLERSRRVLAEIDAAELEISQATSAPRGRLRVSLPVVTSLVLPALTEFMRQYPDIELDLDFTDRKVDVVEEGFDAVVRTGELSDSRLTARTLGEYRMLLVASPAYFKRNATPSHPADLAAHACLHYRYPSSGKLEAWPIRQGPDGPDLSLPTSMLCNSVETLRYFALQGLGIACLPDFAVRDALGDGRLTTVLSKHVLGTGTFRVLWPASRHLMPKLRVFVDFLVDRVFPAKHDEQAKQGLRELAAPAPARRCN